MTVLLSILLGLIPEVLYFTLFLIYTKNITEKRIRLFLFISLLYILCIMICQYKTLYYVLFIFSVYILLKILYKKKVQIIDVFVFSLCTSFLTLSSYICFIFLKKDYSNYYFLYALDRIAIFFPFLFRNKFNILYKKYCRLWNRNDKEKRPIKSITLRNISLIIINIVIFFMNIYAISIIKFLM